MRSNASCSASSAASMLPSACASSNRVDEEPHPLRGQRDGLVADRAALRAELYAYRHVEATARVDLVLHVPQEQLDQLPQAPERRRRHQRGLDHELVEERVRGLDRRQLQLLLRAEVGEEPALAHPDRVSEPADREPVDALDRGEPRRLLQDRLAACFAVTAALAGGLNQFLDKIARPFVYSTHERSY